jgi:hypothetical protein
MMQSDRSLWKIIFGFMTIVAGLVFVGALALSDADILNLERARAQAAQINSRTAYDAQRGQIDLSVYPQLAWERNQAQIRLIRAQADRDAAAAAEAIRVMQAENDRILTAKNRFDRALIWFGVVAAGGLLTVVLYTLLMLAHRTIDRLLPPLPRAGRGATTRRPSRPASDPWSNPAYRVWMRQRARQREREDLAPPAPVAKPAPARDERPLRPNGNGPHHRPMREADTVVSS